MAKKNTTAESYPDEAYRDEALKSGRGVRTEISMKALGTPDPRLQMRVLALDMGHVQTLAAILADQGCLAPITVFRDPVTGELRIADGFHRHETYRKAGLPAIPAIEIEGTLEEAVEFAVMCNRRALLPRKREDVKKAAWALFTLPGWRDKSAKCIGEKLGVLPKTAGLYLQEFCHESNVPMSEFASAADGRVIPRKNEPLSSNNRRISRNNEGEYSVKFAGKKVYLGSNEIDARRNLEGLSRSMLPLDVNVFSRETLSAYTSDSRVLIDGVGQASQLSVRRTRFAAIAIPPSVSTTGIATAVGRVLLAAKHEGLPRSVVLIDGRFSPFKPIMEIGRSLGVEFMTRDEFVEAVKAEESAVLV